MSIYIPTLLGNDKPFGNYRALWAAGFAVLLAGCGGGGSGDGEPPADPIEPEPRVYADCDLPETHQWGTAPESCTATVAQTTLEHNEDLTITDQHPPVLGSKVLRCDDGQLQTISAQCALDADYMPTPPRGNQGEGVNIAILDDGIVRSHQAFSQIRIDVITAGIAEQENPTGMHGTPVASRAFGNRYGSAPAANGLSVEMNSVSDGNAFLFEDAQDAASKAIFADADILNSSYSNFFHRQTPGSEINEALERIAAQDQLWVSSVGNAFTNLSTAPDSLGAFDDYVQANPDSDIAIHFNSKTNDERVSGNHLFVGGLFTKTLDNPGVFDYPGDRRYIQEAYVVREACPVPAASYRGDDTWVDVCGTSFAAPGVAGVAAAIKSYYPDLSMPKIREAILKSADRSFTDAYQHNTCGASGAINCGLFYYGQGRVDSPAAFDYATDLIKQDYPYFDPRFHSAEFN